MRQSTDMPVCRQCSAPFEIIPDDLAFLEKVSPVFNGKMELIPPPTRCFSCRLQRRTAFYNCRSLYRRTCDATGKAIVSIFSPDKPWKVYDKDMWFSDAWDPLSYGRPFDFSRPFFPQFRELLFVVPFQSITHYGWSNLNSDYTNDNYKMKNCYLTFDGEQGEDSYYLHSFVRVRSCMDALHITDSELCFDCVHCHGCYNLRHARFCSNCSDSRFLRDCIGCRNCFGCANLRQRQYCIFNEQKTREEYEAFIAAFDAGSHAAVEGMRKRCEEFFLRHPVKAVRGEQNVGSIGDNLNQSKNAWWCFDSAHQEESRYGTNCMMQGKDLGDVHVWGDGLELCYECCVCGADSRNLLFDYNVTQGTSDVLYSVHCLNGCAHLFGCSGLKRARYCILNKQYTKDEYEALVPRIIAHMRTTGEWGEFFPAEISPFGYNETMAQTYFPLSKEDVLRRGWQWSDYEAPVPAVRSIPADRLPDRIDDIPDDVLQWAIQCEETGRSFKVTKQELEYCRAHRIPLPRRHPDQRHRDRFARKNPYRLWRRSCAKCAKDIQTSYAPDRPEIVYCEECYLASVY